MANIAIIPARGGSQRIPRKNIRPFFGKPILAYSIETALASKLFDRVFVSTDDPMIGVAARQAGATPVLRPAALARDDVGTQEVARDIVLRFPATRYACCIYATAPMMSAQDIIQGFRVITEGGLDFAYSVGPDGADAGQFYWGTAQAFLDRELLDGPRVWKIVVDEKRVCDINTQADWDRAEAMYSHLHQEKP